jgi:DNA polymerase alpha subunit B
VLLVPSVKDLISEHVVYPQGELGREFSGDAVCHFYMCCCIAHVRQIQRIHLLPNPARFMINDISFAITSVDILFHLRKDELLQRGEEIDPISDGDTGSDSMGNLCRHLLQQRRSASTLTECCLFC